MNSGFYHAAEKMKQYWVICSGTFDLNSVEFGQLEGKSLENVCDCGNFVNLFAVQGTSAKVPNHFF
jgi:hypothetical protein